MKSVSNINKQQIKNVNKLIYEIKKYKNHLYVNGKF